jgi:hypothetical protein
MVKDSHAKRVYTVPAQPFVRINWHMINVNRLFCLFVLGIALFAQQRLNI